MLQTYTSDNFDKAKSLYEDAIKSYKECSASDFELSVLYNNLALLYEEKDTKKAGELYCNAIMSTLIPSRIGLYVSNLSDLMKKDTSVQKSAVKIITDNLSQLNGDKKIILLQSLINYGFFDNDERMKRKYLDILSMLAKNCPTPRIKSNVLLTLALEEQTASNYADAKDLYMECISIAIKEKQSDILIRAKIYSCSNSRRMGNKIDFPKLIQNIISYISSADEPENDKAFWYATLAMEAVYRNEWSCFDKLTDLSNKTDGGVAFARKASLYWVQNASDKTNRDSYIRIAKKISDAGIKDMPAETKSIIALHLSMMGNTELSKRFTTPSNINFQV